MNALHLKNRTGRRAGSFVHYEFGQDLFGYIYLDVVTGKKHQTKKVQTSLFANKIDFLIDLDVKLERKERLHYECQPVL